MRRNRMQQLLDHKRRNIGRVISPTISSSHPLWENDYYHYKAQLLDVAATSNRDIQQLIEQYNINPTVFNLKALQRMLEINCKRINQIQNWVSHFPFSRQPATQVQLQRNLVHHFQSCVLSNINTIFIFRGRLAQLVEQRNARDSSFYLNNSANSISWASANKPIHQRGMDIKEVSSQIQALSAILRKMGDIVAEQGDLINRIDENLNEGVDHVCKGRELLGKRVERESGEGEFSCQGKINKVIMSLYITNIMLIVIFLIKNL